MARKGRPITVDRENILRGILSEGPVVFDPNNGTALKKNYKMLIKKGFLTAAVDGNDTMLYITDKGRAEIEMLDKRVIKKYGEVPF